MKFRQRQRQNQLEKEKEREAERENQFEIVKQELNQLEVILITRLSDLPRTLKGRFYFGPIVYFDPRL